MIVEEGTLQPDDGDAVVVAGAVAEINVREGWRQAAGALLLIQPLLDQFPGAVAKIFDVFSRLVWCGDKLW